MANEKVLVVEDEEDALELVAYNLLRRGYRVTTAMDGEQGLQLARERHPDLVVLDLMLPGMDGLDVCARLQDAPATADIPILMLTAKTSELDIITGLEAGAVDYMTKPYSCAELCSRVRRHLDIAHRRKRVETEKERLSVEVRTRTTQLAHADRLASLGTMTAGISHEVNNANTLISGNAEILQDLTPTLLKLAESSPLAGTPEGQTLVREVQWIVSSILEGSRRIEGIVNPLRKFGRGDGGAGDGRTVVREAIQGAVRMIAHRTKRCAEVTVWAPETLSVALEDQKLEQILVNLLTNAADAIEERQRTENEPFGRIAISARNGNGRVLIDVIDNGCGMPEAIQRQVFENFFTTKPPETGTGLGLGIVRSLVEQAGGDIALRSIPGQGTIFSLSLPCAVAAARAG